eukprot:10317337-Prorocentrum_lima.AAC.1
MEPTIHRWVSMRNAEGHPTWVSYDGTVRRTTPWLQGWAEGNCSKADKDKALHTNKQGSSRCTERRNSGT